ncbi:winged helix-turn-helix domain-containing protein [Streptomyces sp. NBC_01483]|uniref:winged helix-turn-helix domain-containing protein n=1 Tax=Streptomyces sp. NBC_01483 TaxID=2903883 RepID=UPI002E381F46|nr:winged helix-turn-helix domain-containing protein [Streptomyces sp. NBC_01483]
MNGSRKPSPAEIADSLRKRIQGDQLKPGTKLPTQAELAQEFGVERGAVRQALNSLRAEGLLSKVTQGRPPTVARPKAEPQPTLVGLAPRLEAAFAVPHVTLDAVCLTAETLMLSMDAPMRLIGQGGVQPESVTARIVLPSKELKLLYPAPEAGWGHDEKVDSVVHDRSMRQHTFQTEVLSQHFRLLKRQYEIPATISFRVVDNTPYHKIYLLNKTEVLLAHYTIGTREEEINGERLSLRDASGTRSTLFAFNKEYGARDEQFVDDSQSWFDALWKAVGPDYLKV